MRGFTPPMFLRHVIPWRVLEWYMRRSAVCRSGVVMWKLGYGGWSWWPHAGCWDGPLGNEYDYCGKWESESAFREKALGHRR